MFSSERLDDLRHKNKELLTKLKLQTEQLQRFTLNNGSITRLACPGGEADNPEEETPERSVRAAGSDDEFLSVRRRKEDRWPVTERSGHLFNGPDPVITTVSEERPQAARDALRKRKTGTKRAEVFGEKTGYSAAEAFTPAEPITEPSQHSEDFTHASLLQDQGNSRSWERSVTKGRMQPKTILLPWDRDRRDLERVSFQFPGQDLETTSERRRMQPLLGYDWIAGLLDAESSLTERSEQFFNELRSFRQVNKDECVHSQSSGPPVVTDFWTSSAEEETDQEHTPDTHQCTFCYRINSRLFASPLDPLAACPICKMPKAKHPHNEKDPAFIRISIPRSTLLPAYRYKAHRRSSFDPTDSLGLPSHCLSGWSNSSLKTGSQMSSLDLRSSVVNRPDDVVPSTQPENQLDLSVSRVSGSQRSDRLLDVSRLTRYRFQHLGPARTKPNKSSYPVF